MYADVCEEIGARLPDHLGELLSVGKLAEVFQQAPSLIVETCKANALKPTFTLNGVAYYPERVVDALRQKFQERAK